MTGARVALVRYVVGSVFGDRALVAFALLVLVALAVAAFLGTTALVEQRELATVFTAAAARLAVVATMTLVMCFQVRRGFEMRDTDLLLSRPISREDFVVAHVVTALLLAMVTSAVAGVAVGIVAQASIGAVLLWTLGVLTEAAIVGVAALFFALSLPSGVASALACFGLYVLSRLVGLLAGVAAAQAETGVTGAFLDHLMSLLVALLPRLDLLAQSSWLVHGSAIDHDVVRSFAQGMVYIMLLAAAAAFDLRRRQL